MRESSQPASSSLFDLTGRSTIVTGASSGLGRQFALALNRAGAIVFAVARREDRLHDLAREAPGVVPIVCDLSSAAARAQLVETVLGECGHIHVLVNNAGVGGSIGALEETIDGFKALIEINLVAPFDLARLAVAGIRQCEPLSIINIASIRGLVGIGKIPAAGYAASKGGVIALTRELASQWGERNVRVNALAPGWFATEMTGDDLAGDEKSARWLRSRTPLVRIGRAGELDGALLFLASDASSYMTGQVVAVDGGWTAL